MDQEKEKEINNIIIERMRAYLNSAIEFNNQEKAKFESPEGKAHCEGAAFALEMAKDHLDFLVKLWSEEAK